MHKGQHCSEETKQNLKEINLGKCPSEATRKKLIESHLGQMPWNKGLNGKGSPFFGKHHTKEAKQKIRESNLGEKHPLWKGAAVGYFALHDWIRAHKPKVERCEECDEKKPLDAANISGEYNRDINDFRWLCHKCHMKIDWSKKNAEV